MRHRTKTQEQIEELFLRADVGRLGTFSSDGFPLCFTYAFFVYFDNKIYMHGCKK